MKLWMSAECDIDIGDKELFPRNHVEDTINAKIQNKYYELELVQWNCIIILMKDDDTNFNERTIYWKKKKDMDFRLKINYKEFDETDDLGRQKLIYQMLERSLDILLKKGLSKQGIEDLRTDVREIAIANSWIEP
ncbi:MAG: hypothetical protein CR967_04190 [Proteobacteria bacterium]|nr:MAG: hypothetical protein CR967_04190 [Pseudomonadota bacterium]